MGQGYKGWGRVSQKIWYGEGWKERGEKKEGNGRVWDEVEEWRDGRQRRRTARGQR